MSIHLMAHCTLGLWSSGLICWYSMLIKETNLSSMIIGCKYLPGLVILPLDCVYAGFFGGGGGVTIYSIFK